MNPRARNFKNYGGRGIRVCDRWRSFRAFLADMGPRPSPKHTVERDDNDGDYTPGNCRWATNAVQQRNRRSNRTVVVKGRRMTVAEASEVSGVPYSRLIARLDLGWPVGRAMSAPRSRRGRRPKGTGPAPASPADMPTGAAGARAFLDGMAGEVLAT